MLRIADYEHYDDKKKEYEIIGRYAKTGITMSVPLAFGVCDNRQKVYMLLTWVEGRDLEEVIPDLQDSEQYQLGVQAGHILRSIHSIEVEEQDLPSTTKCPKKLMQLSKYEESAVRIENDETAISFVREHINQIWKEKPVYQHGDFHPGNLIYMEDGTIGVIDFNRWEVGDPYEEFYKLESFAREISIPYCIGQIDAYFDGQIPEDFWDALAVYVAHASLYSIKWAEKFGQEEIDGMVKRCRQAFLDYDDFHRNVPMWYDAKKGEEAL